MSQDRLDFDQRQRGVAGQPRGGGVPGIVQRLIVPSTPVRALEDAARRPVGQRTFRITRRVRQTGSRRRKPSLVQVGRQLSERLRETRDGLASAGCPW